MKYFLIVLGLLFLLACGDDDGYTVTPGTGTLGSLAYSKSCNEGSFQVYKSQVVGAVGYSQITSLPVGSSVSVKGVVNNSPCHSGSSVSFTCEGSVSIGTNRTISCTSGTVHGTGYGLGHGPSHGPGYATATTTVTTTTNSLLPNLLNPSNSHTTPACDPLLTPSCATTNPHVNPLQNAYTSNLVGGQIHTYDNGTKAFVSIQFPHPSPLGGSSHGHCSAGFLCQ